MIPKAELQKSNPSFVPIEIILNILIYTIYISVKSWIQKSPNLHNKPDHH